MRTIHSWCPTILTVTLAVVLLALLGPEARNLGAAEGQRFAVLNTGAQTFSNVVVVSFTTNDIFISHSAGFANIKIKDLDHEVQERLGVVVETAPEEAPKPTLAQKLEQNVDPRVLEARQQMILRFNEVFRRYGQVLIWGILGGLAIFYLFFCFCCMHICKKTGENPGLLVWIPIVQKLPLLKAARMPGLWFVLWILPPTAWMVWIRWSFAIAKARGKSWLVGLALLLPVTSIFAFLYLAFSGGAEEEETESSPTRAGALVLR